MKFTKTLLTTALFSFSVFSISQMAYANSAQETQLQQGTEAYDRSDFAILLKVLKPLAEQGNDEAQYELGIMYYKGSGVKQDYVQAVKWFQKAVAQGNAKAQAILGIMYSLGKGVKQDRNLAKMWAGKACDNGNQNGCDLYRILNEEK